MTYQALWHAACNGVFVPLMRLRHSLNLLLATAFLAGGSVLAGAEAKSVTTAKESAAKGAAAASVQELLQQVSTQRERLIAEHEALAKQLRVATEEQRKAILEKMQEQKKAFEAAQSTLHKQIRDEQRRQRQGAVPRR